MTTIRRVVYPGTFDPAHFGHIDIATRAARVFDEVIIAVYEHPEQNASKKVLFTAKERVHLLQEAVKDFANITVARFSGLAVNYVREVGAFAMIRGLRVFSDFELEFRMALANRRLAPEIEVVSLIADERHLHISSSTVREVAQLGGDVSSMVPPHVAAALKQKFGDTGRENAEADYMISLRD
jgi:pantetheine-phosphate adenylyltransferase